ncbi:hypothetical protein [Vibrio antiquarius]|nr:hypothetical protein [Vibrio antiquarius]MCR9845777.1 hypothetical protein [Vibrio antiquarius]
MKKINTISKLNTSVVKRIIYIIVFLIPVLFIFKPFINGVGCNFTLEAESVNYIQKNKCKMGILVIHTEDRFSGQIVVKKMMWGYWEGYNYTWNLETRIIKDSVNSFRSKTDLYHVYNLIVGKSYKVKDMPKLAWVYDQPFEVIYYTSDKAKLGFIEP